MYCYKCGAYVSERDTECYMCGSSINAQRETLIRIKRRHNALENLKKSGSRKNTEKETALKQEAIRQEAARLAAVRQEAQKASERPEAERLEAERQKAARLEAERLEAECQEAARLEAERLEAERQKTARLEAERLEAERLEAERQEAIRQSLRKRETSVLYTDEVPKNVITPMEPVRNKPETSTENASSREGDFIHPNYLPEEYYTQKEENVSAGPAASESDIDRNRAIYGETRQEKSSYSPVPPESPARTVPENTRKNIIMQVFCFIAAGAFVWFAFSGIRGYFYNISYALGYFLSNPMGNVLLLLSSLFGLLGSVISLGIAGLFGVAALRWTREKAEAYFAVTAEAAVVLIVFRFLSAVLMLLTRMLLYYYPSFDFRFVINGLLFCAAALVAYFGVNAVCGMILFKGMAGDKIRHIFMKAPAAVMDYLKRLSGGRQEADEVGEQPFDAGTRQKEVNVQEEGNESKRYQAGSRQTERSFKSPSVSGTQPLTTNRGLLKYIVYGFLTCGIYQLYVIHKIAADVNVACDGDGKSTAGLLKLIIFTFLTCGIYSWIWCYKLGNRLQDNAPRFGMHFSENGTTILMWELFGILLCGIGPFIAMNIILNNTNAICAAYNEDNGL